MHYFFNVCLKLEGKIPLKEREKKGLEVTEDNPVNKETRLFPVID